MQIRTHVVAPLDFAVVMDVAMREPPAALASVVLFKMENAAMAQTPVVTVMRHAVVWNAASKGRNVVVVRFAASQRRHVVVVNVAPSVVSAVKGNGVRN